MTDAASGEVLPFRASQATDKPARELPASIEAEQCVLGAILVNNEAYAHVVDILRPEHFCDEVHGRLYQMIGVQIGAGRAATPVTLHTHFDFQPRPECTPAQYLARLAAEAVTVINARDYATIVRDLAHRRALIEAGNALINDAYGMAIERTAALAVEEFNESVRPVVDSAAARTLGYAGDHANHVMDELEAVQNGSLQVELFSTGYERLNAVMRWRPGDLIITAGRPGMGKSVTATSMARRIAKSGIGVLEFPLENGRDEATARHLAEISFRQVGPITYKAIIERDIGSEADRDKLRRAATSLKDLPIIIDDSERITVEKIGARVRLVKERLRRRNIKLGVVILDHLDYVDAGARYSGNRTQEIGEIVLGLKALARREEVSVNLLCQLNRALETRGREDRRPTLADLRNSGDLEQCADEVIFVYREAYYIQRDPAFIKGNDPEIIARELEMHNRLELIVGKARRGPTANLQMWCDPSASYVSEMIR